jgi:hypothetical protein
MTNHDMNLNRIVNAIDYCVANPVTRRATRALAQFTSYSATLLTMAQRRSYVSWHEGKPTSLELVESDLRQLSRGERHHVVIPDTSNAEFHDSFLIAPAVSVRSALQRPTRSGIIRAYHDIVGHAGMLDDPAGRVFFDFSFCGELKASLRALRHLQGLGASDSVLSVAAADSIGQTIYHRVKGVFPAVQVPMLHDDLGFDYLRHTAIDILIADLDTVGAKYGE